jgi:hypothetical protein
MSSGHSDHAYAPSNKPESTPPSAPMSETARSGSSIGATMPLVSSTTTAGNKTKKIEKQSLEYAIRSGIAGGLAGCAVSSRHLQMPRPWNCDIRTDWRFSYRPKPLLHRSTVSRSSSKLPIPSSPSTPAAGQDLLLRSKISTAPKAPKAFTRATPSHSSASSPTPPSSSSPTNRSAQS